MYFITKGYCHVHINGYYIRKLTEGDYFGEIAMLLWSQRRTATVKTCFYCEFYTIEKDVLEDMLNNYHKDGENIKKYAKQRFLENKDLIPEDLLDVLYYTQDSNISVTNI